jgi:hypothetical protein
MEIKRVRGDNEKLRRNAQRLLGQQLDPANVGALIAVSTRWLMRTTSRAGPARSAEVRLRQAVCPGHAVASNVRSQLTVVEPASCAY